MGEISRAFNERIDSDLRHLDIRFSRYGDSEGSGRGF
jgi:hypothetical protein